MKTVTYNVLEIDTILDFGKYKGKMVIEIKKIDPQYILWIHNNNIRNFIITDKVLYKEIHQNCHDIKEFNLDRLGDSESIY